jgi:glycosyltransferase involved in cell wall biosynthesis
MTRVSSDFDLKKQSDISVALATYNGGRFLREQLDSLARQTLLPRELVVTDDGSSDDTLEIVESFARTAPFSVRSYRNERRYGYADNFLQAASLCRGEWVAFCDQDDVWFDTKLAICAQHFTDSFDVTLVVHSAQTWDGKSPLVRRFPHFTSTSLLSAGTSNPFQLTPGFAMVFRRELLSLVDFTNRPGCIFGPRGASVMAHDSWIWMLATSTGSVVTLAEALAFYRQHPTNTVGAPRKKGILSKVRMSLRTVDYAYLAEIEATIADILNDVAARLDAPHAAVTREISKSMRRRSEMLSQRESLYNPSSSILRRIQSFRQIARLGGYASDQSKMRLGKNALIKDTLLGVTGLFPKS